MAQTVSQPAVYANGLKQSTSSWRFYSSYYNDVLNHEPKKKKMRKSVVAFFQSACAHRKHSHFVTQIHYIHTHTHTFGFHQYATCKEANLSSVHGNTFFLLSVKVNRPVKCVYKIMVSHESSIYQFAVTSVLRVT